MLFSQGGMPRTSVGGNTGGWDGNVDTLYGFHSFMSYQVAFICECRPTSLHLDSLLNRSVGDR